jgi:lysophospholipase L1-like esterase
MLGCWPTSKVCTFGVNLLLFAAWGCSGAGSTVNSNARGGASNGGSPAGGAETGDATALGGSMTTGGTSSKTGSPTIGGAASTGGGNSTGGAPTGGSVATVIEPATGGATTTGGGDATGGVKATGGVAGTGGSQSAGGTSNLGGAIATGGLKSTGGVSNTGGSKSAGGATATGGVTGSSVGAGGGTGTFDPCPASDACKVLPLGDSITWGVNYDGGYRIKLFANTITDKKNITYVGKLSNGPATVSGVTFPTNNEGHSGWTIQQIDDIVTGSSTDANYKGKKMIVDLAPNIILLHAGTNDTSRSPSGMTDRLGALIDHIVGDSPNVLLVVTTIIPIKQGSYGSVGETFDNAVPDVVQKRIDAGRHVVLVDMFKNFPSNGLSSDGVHPNQQGYDWMAGVWYDAIQGYLH